MVIAIVAIVVVIVTIIAIAFGIVVARGGDSLWLLCKNVVSFASVVKSSSEKLFGVCIAEMRERSLLSFTFATPPPKAVRVLRARV